MAGFMQKDGKPLQVFVVIIGFTKEEVISLGTAIEAQGGQCSGFNAADLVLTKSTTILPQAFLQSLSHHVLLDVRWFQACLQAGRLLGAEEDWGGYRLTPGQNDAGPPGYGKEADEVLSSSPPHSGWGISPQGSRFTEEDDNLLVHFCREHLFHSSGSNIAHVLEQLANEHPHHTLEEWRYQYSRNEANFNARIFQGDAEALLLSFESLGTRIF